ncbi:MAG: hypothetical protein HOV94_40325 [Saccharothrix sp.]|nr:hypothetical protein [Saccharothrix sp.]
MLPPISFNDLAQSLADRWDLPPDLCRTYLVEILHANQDSAAGYVDWNTEMIQTMGAVIVQGAFHAHIGVRGQRLLRKQD